MTSVYLVIKPTAIRCERVACLSIWQASYEQYTCKSIVDNGLKKNIFLLRK